MKVGIEYCVECMFLGRALEIARLLLEEHHQQIQSLELIPGRDGVFTVRLDGEPIFHIGSEGLLPSVEEILRRVERRLQLAA